MAGKTIGDATREALAKGVDPTEILASFKRVFGVDLKSLPPDTPLAAVAESKARRESETGDKFDRFPQPVKDPSVLSEMVGRPAKWAGGVVAGIPALAAGAAKTLEGFAPGVGLTEAQREALATPEREAEYGRRQREAIAAVKDAANKNREVRKNRAGTPTATAVLQDLGDVVAGMGHLIIGQGLNMEGPRNESPIDTAKRRFQQGGEMAAGMAGGIADQVRGLADPAAINSARTQMASTAFAAVPAAKALRMGTLAAGEAAAGRAGVVGKAGRAATATVRTLDKGIESTHGFVEHVKQAVNPFPGSEELATRFDEAGHPNPATAVTAETPLQTVAKYHPAAVAAAPYANAAGKILKGAAIGAALGDTVVGPFAGAAMGAIPPALAELAKTLSPAKYAAARAKYMRQVADPASQPTPLETEVTREIIEPPVKIGAEVEDLSREAAGQYKRGEVEFLPDEDPQQRHVAVPPVVREVLEVRQIPAKGGKPQIALVPPGELLDQRLPVGEKAVGLGRYIDAVEREEAKIAPDDRKALKKEATEQARAKNDEIAKGILADTKLEAEKIAAERKRQIEAEHAAFTSAIEKKKARLDDIVAKQRAAVDAAPRGQKGPAAKAAQVEINKARDLFRQEVANSRDLFDRVRKTINDETAVKATKLWDNYRAVKTGVWEGGKEEAKAAREALSLKSPDLKTELNEMRHGKDWSTGLDIEAGLRTQADLKPAPLKTTSQAISEITDRAYQAMTAAGQDIPRHWFQRVFTSVLNDEAKGLLFTPRFRALLTQTIADDLGLSSKKTGVFKRTSPEYRQFALALDNKLIEVNKNLFGANPTSIDFQLPNGQRVSLETFVEQTVVRNPKLLDELRADAMEHIGRTLKIQAEDSHLANALNREVFRFAAPAVGEARPHPQGVADSATYFANVMQRAGNGAEALPLAVPYDPAVAATRMRVMVADGLVPPGKSAHELVAMADHLDSLKQASPEVRKYFDDLQKAGAVDKPGDGLWLTAGMDATMTARINLLKVARSLDALDMTLAQFKLAYTAFRFSTWVNNFGSNLMFDFVTEGKQPAALMAEVVDATRSYQSFLKGERLASPEEARMYHALSRAGMGTLANLAGELDALAAFSSPHGMISAAAHHVGNLAKRGYNFGDMPFKIRKAVNRYQATWADLQDLEVGEWGRLEIGGESVVDVERRVGGWKANGLGINEQQLADLVGKAAVKLAHDSFINNAHAPIWLQKLRAGRWTTLASPFLSWGWGALELPGKPGLLSASLAFDGGSMLTTNSPKLLARWAVSAGMVSARRAALLGATRSQLHESRDFVRKVMPFEWGNEGAVDVQPGHTPGTAAIHDFTSTNPFSRAALVWRLGNAGIGKLFGAKSMFTTADKVDALEADLDSKDPHKQRRGQYMLDLYAKKVSAKTLLDAMALSGNTFLDLARDLEDASDPRGHSSPEQAILKFAVNLMGGTVSDTMRVVLGAQDPLNPVSGRPYLWTGATGKPEDWGAWAVQRLVSIGYLDKSLEGDRSQAKAYLTRFKTALTQSLSRDVKARTEKLFNEGGAAATAEIEKLFDLQIRAKFLIDKAVLEEELKFMEKGYEFNKDSEEPEEPAEGK